MARGCSSETPASANPLAQQGNIEELRWQCDPQQQQRKRDHEDWPCRRTNLEREVRQHGFNPA